MKLSFTPLSNCACGSYRKVTKKNKEENWETLKRRLRRRIYFTVRENCRMEILDAAIQPSLHRAISVCAISHNEVEKEKQLPRVTTVKNEPNLLQQSCSSFAPSPSFSPPHLIFPGPHQSSVIRQLRQLYWEALATCVQGRARTCRKVDKRTFSMFTQFRVEAWVSCSKLNVFSPADLNQQMIAHVWNTHTHTGGRTKATALTLVRRYL